jgi:hypothetical protein
VVVVVVVLEYTGKGQSIREGRRGPLLRPGRVGEAVVAVVVVVAERWIGKSCWLLSR